jgi:uncharacterized protein YutE (UPF0331/DUF86 family)
VNDEVLAQKITSIQRCVARAREELARSGKAFRTDYGAQDAAILNVIRGCDTAIDLANVVIRQRHLGIPTESRDSFQILMREKLIEFPLGERLKTMVGFRNLALHQYRELNMDIVEAVIGKGRDDLLEFANAARSLVDSTHS